MEKVKIQKFSNFLSYFDTSKKLFNNFQKKKYSNFIPPTDTYYVRGQDKHIFTEINTLHTLK